MMHSKICLKLHAEANATVDGGGTSVWEHVIHGLLHSYRSKGDSEAHWSLRTPRVAAYVPSAHIQVEVIEWLSDTSVAVLWQDATRCRYDDQVWISCRSRLKGYCVLSGAVIRRDDLVYKPRVRTTTPANASAMILASVIERMPAMTETGASR